MILGFVSSRPVGRSVDKPISARGALLAVGRAAEAEAEAEATTPEVSAEGTTEAMMSPREGVNVRIRGHGETTLQEKFHDLEAVAMFKKRVFGAQIREGRQCRLISRGRELQDTAPMGDYKIEDGACLHVMIGRPGSAARSARSAHSASSTGASGSQEPLTSGRGFAVLCISTLIICIMAWACMFKWPQFFSAGSTVLLLLLSLAPLRLSVPMLKAYMAHVRRGREAVAQPSARRRQ